MKIYIGNLSPEITDADLRKLFAPHGRVESARVLPDSVVGNDRGSGLVFMPSRSAALEATAALHGHKLKGQILEVMEVRIPPKRLPGQIYNHTKGTRRGNQGKTN